MMSISSSPNVIFPVEDFVKIEGGKSKAFVEKVISSQYLVQRILYLLLSNKRSVSSFLQIKFEMIGDVGAPCGSTLLQHTNLASKHATE